MSTVIDIVNLALSHIGEVPNVASISPPEGSAHAEKAARFYPLARDKCLEAHNWNFAVKRVKLSGLENPVGPWLYAYGVPSDLIRSISVRGNEGEGFANFQDRDSLRGIHAAYGNSIDDELGVSDFIIENNILYTNAEEATLRYVFKQSDTTRWTPRFSDAVSWLLASYLAGAITQDERIKNWAYQMYQNELQGAMVTDSMGMRRTNKVNQAPWIRDR